MICGTPWSLPISSCNTSATRLGHSLAAVSPHLPLQRIQHHWHHQHRCGNIRSYKTPMVIRVIKGGPAMAGPSQKASLEPDPCTHRVLSRPIPGINSKGYPQLQIGRFGRPQVWPIHRESHMLKMYPQLQICRLGRTHVWPIRRKSHMM